MDQGVHWEGSYLIDVVKEEVAGHCDGMKVRKESKVELRLQTSLTAWQVMMWTDGAR